MPCLARPTGEGPDTSPPARGLDDGTVYRQVLQVEPAHPVVAGQGGLQQLLGHAAGGHRFKRRRIVRPEQPGTGDALVAAAMDQRGDPGNEVEMSAIPCFIREPVPYLIETAATSVTPAPIASRSYWIRRIREERTTAPTHQLIGKFEAVTVR